MAMKSATTLNNNLRNLWLCKLIDLISGENPDAPTDILQVSSGKLAIPTLDEDNNEKWVTITISVPKGTRDGDEFDGYAEAQFYREQTAEKEEKRQAREAEKKRKADEREAKKQERLAKKQAEETPAE